MTLSRPSKKRRALAIYFDFALFGLLGLIVSRLLFDSLIGFLEWLIIFLVVEAILLRLKYSPGYYILSIYAVDSAELPDAPDAKYGKILIVDPEIKNNENGWSMITGFLYVNSGLKGMGRWLSHQPIMPLFGFEYDSVMTIVANVVFGACSFVIGYLVYKLRRPALTCGLLFIAVSVPAVLMSMNDWILMAEAKNQWRAAYGGELRSPEELAAMLPFIKWAFVATTAFSVFLFFKIRNRLAR